MEAATHLRARNERVLHQAPDLLIITSEKSHVEPQLRSILGPPFFITDAFAADVEPAKRRKRRIFELYGVLQVMTRYAFMEENSLQHVCLDIVWVRSVVVVVAIWIGSSRRIVHAKGFCCLACGQFA